MRAGALQGFDELVRRWGHDPLRLRRRRGLAGRGAARDPETMVSLNAVALLLDDAARACQRADFGLRLGTTFDPAMLGLLAVVVQGAETAGAALVDASRYLFVHSPNYQMVLEPEQHEPWRTLRFDVEIDDDVPLRQLIDGCLMSLVNLGRAMTGPGLTPVSVALPHSPVASPQTYRELFGAPVLFEQPKAALHLPAALLDAPLQVVRPDLRRHALAYLAERYPNSDTTMTTLVRNVLRGTIGVSRGRKTDVAALLGLHPRTLQRRLSAEGQTFEAIRDDVHRTATWRLLTESTLPLGQTAHVLGFSEQSSMNRSVRGWFDATPKEIRHGQIRRGELRRNAQPLAT